MKAFFLLMEHFFVRNPIMIVPCLGGTPRERAVYGQHNLTAAMSGVQEISTHQNRERRTHANGSKRKRVNWCSSQTYISSSSRGIHDCVPADQNSHGRSLKMQLSPTASQEELENLLTCGTLICVHADIPCQQRPHTYLCVSINISPGHLPSKCLFTQCLTKYPTSLFHSLCWETSFTAFNSAGGRGN